MYQHRQIHVWISESDYLLLQEQAVVTRESVSALIRRFIKNGETAPEVHRQGSEFRVLGSGCCELITAEPGTEPCTLNAEP